MAPSEPGPQVVNLAQKFSKFTKTFTPHIVADVNEFHVLLAKLAGEFVEHRHDDEDEMFLVVKGQLTLKMKERTVTLAPGELFVVPRGMDHLPRRPTGPRSSSSSASPPGTPGRRRPQGRSRTTRGSRAPDHAASYAAFVGAFFLAGMAAAERRRA